MAKQEYDFIGWATKNDIRCSDGRTIRHNAFADNDGKRVPLVWNHQHNDIDNVLGYAILKNADDGVRAYGFFNTTEKGRNAKTILEHGDITSLSIYANKLKQVGGDVIHGDIKEVSLVLAGANPGAYIDEIRHGEDSILDAIVLSTGEELTIEHGEFGEAEDEIPEEEKVAEEVTIESKEVDIAPVEPVEEKKEEPEKAEEPAQEEAKEPEKEAEEVLEGEPGLEHAEKEAEEVADQEKTVQEVIDSMTEEQKNVMYALVGMAAEDAKKEEKEEENEDMKHNFFADENNEQNELVHGEIVKALGDAKRFGSAREALIENGLNPEEVLVHGVEHVDYLMPEYRNVHGNKVPFITNSPSGWVSIVMNGVHKTPFAKVKMMFADITANEARAKGYVKGAKKLDEIFTLLKREIAPTTVFKKQSFDRDDVIDITDFDLLGWVKDELKIKWDEEVARAILFSDGRSVSDPDKIPEANIVPVAFDTANNLYAIAANIVPGSNEALAHAVINGLVKALDNYEGSGNIIAFIRADLVSDMMLMEDKNGNRLYKTMEELAGAAGVEKIVKVPAGIVPQGIYGVALDLNDYNVGANKGGERSLFDDFDIDYNKQKYLLEGRCSGGLIKPHSAVVLQAGSPSMSSPELEVEDGQL